MLDFQDIFKYIKSNSTGVWKGQTRKNEFFPTKASILMINHAKNLKIPENSSW